MSDWINDPRMYRPFTREEPNGEVITYRLYTIGAVAAAVDKSPAAIRQWIAKRVIPDSTWRTEAVIGSLGDSGVRLWSKDQIDALVAIAKQEKVAGRTKRDIASFEAKIWARWTQEGWLD
jgi:hypothetical protein